MFLRLAYKSLLNRKGSVMLTLLALTVSILVLLGVEHIRQQAKENFSNTLSGVDLMVGARTGSLNLLLYSVFRVGSPTNNISWDAYQKIRSGKQVAWAVPISLGDSYRGYRVMGTTTDYFQHFSYGDKRQLEFSRGKPFNEMFDVVLGADVAKQLNHRLGDELILSHGIASTRFNRHDDRPFKVVGILVPTGTPVDQTVHVSLEGIEAIHIGWNQGTKIPGFKAPGKKSAKTDLSEARLEPKSITAFMLGLKSRIATFKVQREINDYRGEPLLAILPGVALSELWQVMAMFENTLRLISVFILIAALLGLSSMLLASIREREREIQLLRAIGASPLFLFLLIELEAVLICLCSILLGVFMLYLGLTLVGDMLIANFGLRISAHVLSESNLYLLLWIITATVIAAAIPSINAYMGAYRSAKTS